MEPGSIVDQGYRTGRDPFPGIRGLLQEALSTAPSALSYVLWVWTSGCIRHVSSSCHSGVGSASEDTFYALHTQLRFRRRVTVRAALIWMRDDYAIFFNREDLLLSDFWSSALGESTSPRLRVRGVGGRTECGQNTESHLHLASWSSVYTGF